MDRKRLIALLLSVLLLAGIPSAHAVTAGSANDPLLSQSYVSAWQTQQLQQVTSRAEELLRATVTDGLRELQYARGRMTDISARSAALSSGNTAALTEGDGVTVVSGSVGCMIQKGTLIDITAGRAVSSGTLELGHRYIAGPDLKATLTCNAAAALLLTGNTTVSRFADVSPTAWYAEAIDYATVNGLVNGMSPTRYEPNTTLTRAMFITILGRMAGADPAKYPGVSFQDVKAGSWYASYVEWGVKAGIVNGTSPTTFSPNSPITREQMAALIARYVKYAGVTLPNTANLKSSFTDSGKISGWAYESVLFTQQTGILAGDAAGTFRPKDGATRAEAATVFMRLHATLAIL